MAHLGLDLSLSGTGFFLLGKDGDNVNLEIGTSAGQFTCLVKRCKFIADVIVRQMKDYEARTGDQIELVLLEDYHMGKFALPVISLSALGTMVRHRLLEEGYPFVVAQPSQIKKYESGSGASKKGNMVKEVFKNHNFDTKSDNIADACAMAYLCKDFLLWRKGLLEPKTQYKKAVLKAMKDVEIEPPYPKEIDATGEGAS